VAITCDATEVNLQQVTSGRITGVMAQNPYRMGYECAKYAFMKLNGESVPSITDSGVQFVGIAEAATYDATKN